MYTELVCAFELREDTPKHVVDTLLIMTGKLEFDSRVIPYHPLFKTSRWSFMLVCDSSYFPGESNSNLEFNESAFLTVRSNLKNYDNEIDLFIDWITPYISMNYAKVYDGEYKGKMFIGYYRYEEDEHPTLIYV